MSVSLFTSTSVPSSRLLLLFPMECSVCSLTVKFEKTVQLVPCLHTLCKGCFQTIGKYSKTCPFVHCFSPLRLQPDLRLNKCENPSCRRRIAPMGDMVFLECDHSLCGECNSELFRGRRSSFCPECEAPVAGEGEEACDVCSKFGPTDKSVVSVCCAAKLCAACAERGRKDREKKGQSKEDEVEGAQCPEGKCPKNNKKKTKKDGDKDKEKEKGNTCTCGIVCDNEPLPNFPTEQECEHDMCIECLDKALEASEKSKQVPCCPNEMCRTPYRSESVLALRVLFPDRKGYFDMFEVGYHFGFEKLKDDSVTEIEFGQDFDTAKRMFKIKVAVLENESNGKMIEYDKKGNFGDLLREARKALKIGVTEKVYGYYLRLDGQDKAVQINNVLQDLESAGVLRATMVMVDTTGIVSAKASSLPIGAKNK